MKYINNRDLLLVIVLGTLLFLPFLGQVHLFDWDEANFAEAAREMILRNNYSRVTIDFDPFYEKPPLFFWLQALSMQVFGIGEYAARFPSALIGILTLVSIFYIGRKHHNLRTAWLWVLLYIASWTPHIYFKSGIIDPTFNFFIFLSVYFYFKREDLTISRMILSSMALALAIITKGPVALLIVGLVVFFYTVLYNSSQFLKSRFYLRHILYLFFIIAFSSVWYIYTSIGDGGEYIRHFIDYQLELLTQGVATHGQPVYYHFVVLLIGCFPASIFLLNSKAWTVDKKKESNNSLRFARAMKVLFWVVLILFSLVKTKIVHYSSMCYLPLTYIAACYIDQVAYTQSVLTTKLIKISYWLIGSVWALALIALPILAQNPESLIPLIHDDNTLNALEVPVQWSYWLCLPGVILLFVLFYFWKYRKKHAQRSLTVFLLVCTLVIQSILYLFVPRMSQYSQGESVAYYKDFADKKVDLRTYDYKSYAVFFYGKRQPENKDYPEKYYVCHKAQAEGIIEKSDPPLEEVNTHYNFTLLKEIKNENQEKNTE